jgi:hypothetical protein
MVISTSQAELEAQLVDFDPAARAAALHELVQRQLVASAAPAEVANMHCHTFFSYNAYGHSPSSLAWLARQHGYNLMGIVDFDVLDGVDEFLDACFLTGVRGSAGIETRIYLPEFAEHEMNSPGEPGVLYHMGIGFTATHVAPQAAALIAELREQSAQRNLGLIRRVNAYLDPIAVDYAGDVLPLTPKGNATERHIVVAYVRAAERRYPAEADRIRFWADRLQMEPGKTAQLMADAPAFQNQMRAKLMKKGGVGYVQPGHDTFPPLDKLHAMILACQALPCAAWLDGTTSGEQRIDALLELLVSRGAVALNIVPDRNWNIADAETKRVKVQNLYDLVALAQAMELPLNVGTEMNSFGNKLIDDFDAAELAPVRQPFLDGAYFVYGHTTLQRQLGLGYQSDWANAHLPARRARNDFYTRIGKAVPPGEIGARRLSGISPEHDPTAILRRIGAE